MVHTESWIATPTLQMLSTRVFLQLFGRKNSCGPFQSLPLPILSTKQGSVWENFISEIVKVITHLSLYFHSLNLNVFKISLMKVQLILHDLPITFISFSNPKLLKLQFHTHISSSATNSSCSFLFFVLTRSCNWASLQLCCQLMLQIHPGRPSISLISILRQRSLSICCRTYLLENSLMMNFQNFNFFQLSEWLLQLLVNCEGQVCSTPLSNA